MRPRQEAARPSVGRWQGGSRRRDVSAEPDDNALQRGYRQLLDELGRGYDPSLSYVDHVAVVEVTSDAGTFSVLSLGEELGNQVARQEELLSERDREIFERHLLTRVSEALRELLNDADELVGRINRSLADRPTASGKSVQLRWELDSADVAVRTAVGLLRKTPELLGPEQVPALMVYDLPRQPPLEGVSAFAVRWDGAAMAEA